MCIVWTISAILSKILGMQIALITLFSFGLLLFLISFLGYARSAFKHHFVTGLISLLPVLNIITLPSLWDKNSRKFFIGLMGLVILSVSWFFGADNSVKNLFSQKSSFLSQNTSNASGNKASVTDADNSTVLNRQNKTFSLNESNMLSLPQKALYKMQFDLVPVDQISVLQGRIVQITTTDNELIEGRVKHTAPGSVVLEGVFENELPVSSIKQLKLMVKKSN